MAKRPGRPSFDIHKQNLGRASLWNASDLSDGVFEPVSRSLPQKSTIQQNYYTAVRSLLSEVEDRRTFNPAGRFRPAASSRRHLVKTKPIKLTGFASSPIHGFVAPRGVAICVRRKIRREVIFARGKQGRGNKKPRYNLFSKVRC